MDTTVAFRLGDCDVQPDDHSIHCKNGHIRTLQPKYMEVLVYLAKHYPRVIPRQELIKVIWDNNEYVGEKALTNTIWHLRQNLCQCISLSEQNQHAGDADTKNTSSNQSVIKTIRKSGYQLLIQPYWNSVSEQNQKDLNPEHKNAEAKQNIVSNTHTYKTMLLLVLCALGVFTVWTWLFPFVSNIEGSPSFTIQQITKDPGSEVHPAPSPDGRYVAYAWFAPDGRSNLFIKDLEQPQLAPKQLTFDGAQQRISVWSNDGQYLYFARDNKQASTCDIIKLKVITNQESKVAECARVGGYHYLDISPDDKFLAFRGYDAKTRNTGIYFLDLQIEGSTPVRFSCNKDCQHKDRSIAFSPNGKTLAVSRRNYWFSEDIVLIDLASNEEQILVTDEPDIAGLTWHQSGNYIIYATQRADVTRGFIVDVKTKQSTLFKTGEFLYPLIAKQTGDIFYQSQSERYFIEKLNLDSEVNSSSFPVIESEFSHLYPDYSVNANAIVYVSNESGFYELWMADSEGLNREQLTFLEKDVNYPRWSHDGTKVAFLAPIENTKSDKIHILDIASKQVSTLLSPYHLHNRPTWSYDDSAIISSVYTDEFKDLVKIKLSDGTSKRLTYDNGRYGVMISPDTIIYTRSREGLWKKRLDDDTSKRLLGKEFSARYSWIYNNGNIYFSQNEAEAKIYIKYDLVEQSFAQILRLPANRFGGYQEISINPNKQELLFTTGKSAQSDIKKLKLNF